MSGPEGVDFLEGAQLSEDGRCYLLEGEPDLSGLADKAFGYESYAPLDGLARCGVAEAIIGIETMPDAGERRGSISSIHPSGWVQARYPDLIAASDGALYNRSHLIGWALSAENANERNLITGTRRLNETMTIFEQRVAAYINSAGGHVCYRVTPVFEGDELLARGVLMEAMSVEDGGGSVRFRAYVPNTQEGVVIDYATGESRLAESEGPSQAESAQMNYALNTNTRRFHLPDCPSAADIREKNRAEKTATRDELAGLGYSPCGRCNP